MLNRNFSYRVVFKEQFFVAAGFSLAWARHAVPLRKNPFFGGNLVSLIMTTASQVPRESLDRFTHLYAGRHPGSKQVSPWTCPGVEIAPSFDALSFVSTPHQWFACARLPEPHLPRSCAATRDFSLKLTTLALYQRSLRWFGACSYKPAPGGAPPSLAQLRTPSL
jgi:hypothetical protein